MKYFKLTEAIDNKIIGRYPQGETSKIVGNLNDFYWNKLNGKDIDIVLPHPIIVDKAKTTDYISVVPINSLAFLILKLDLCSLIENSNIKKFQKWNIKVDHKKKTLGDYQLFWLIESSENEVVQYTISDFFIGKLGDRRYKGNSISISSSENYFKINRELMNNKLILKCNELVLDFSVSNNDLIKLTNAPFANGYYVSEKLKYDIESQGYTGINFMETSKINSKVKVIY